MFLCLGVFAGARALHAPAMDYGRTLKEARYGEIARQITAASQTADGEESLEQLVKALGTDYQSTATLFDELTGQDDLHSTIAAADLLLLTVREVKRSSYGETSEIVNFPDDLMDRAASLLDHPDPVVQAMAEWTIALRVKKQNEMTRKLYRLLVPGQCEKGW